ncbi:MAG: hypothetical protein OXN89_06560, partial [Bryobacterales bacterium]|nr:hypothetical protein [Bryobacterales bacterium]
SAQRTASGPAGHPGRAGLPAAISDTTDGLPAEDRASRDPVPLHRSAQALSDKILKGLQPLER